MPREFFVSFGIASRFSQILFGSAPATHCAGTLRYSVLPVSISIARIRSSVAAAMKQAYLHADPDFRFVEMRPRPIDLGIVDVANRTFDSMGTWKTAVQWMLWLGFGTVLAAIFYLTR